MSLAMIIPDRDPRKALMACQKIKILAILSKPPTIVVQSSKIPVGNMYSANVPAVTHSAWSVLIDIITEEDDIVDRVLVLISNEVASICRGKLSLPFEPRYRRH